MIDLHTHSLLSDGVLLPSELVRRAEEKGYEAIAVTDHADMSNIDFIVPRIVTVCRILNKHWMIKSIPGVEITHVPIEEIPGLVKFARAKGAKVIVGHGETLCEPVLRGTNKAFILAKVDILAHPGNISDEDTELAGKKKVLLEITSRKGHSMANQHVVKMAKSHGAKMILNSDAHQPKDLLDDDKRNTLLKRLYLTNKEIKEIIANSVRLIKAQ